jgi:superfamily II DNA/RNA helicase
LTAFQDFGLAEPITRSLAEENCITPTPIQAQTIPVALSRRAEHTNPVSLTFESCWRRLRRL